MCACRHQLCVLSCSNTVLPNVEIISSLLLGSASNVTKLSHHQDSSVIQEFVDKDFVDKGFIDQDTLLIKILLIKTFFIKTLWIKTFLIKPFLIKTFLIKTLVKTCMCVYLSFPPREAF